MGKKDKLTEVRNEVFTERNKQYLPNEGTEQENNIKQPEEHDNYQYLYDVDTVSIIKKAMLDYVTNTNLPLCEYLSFEKLSEFISESS